MTIARRGIPEVPLNPTDPKSAEEMRQLLVQMRQTIVDLRGPKATPTAPTNLKATAMAYAILLQWTPGQNADTTEILWNSTPSLASATLITQVAGGQYTDYVGNSGVTRYYWARSVDLHGRDTCGCLIRSIESGPVSATTLASGTGVVTPPPPPPGQSIVTQPITGRKINQTGG